MYNNNNKQNIKVKNYMQKITIKRNRTKRNYLFYKPTERQKDLYFPVSSEKW